MLKRIISLLLSMAMVVSLLPVQTFAADSEPETAEQPEVVEAAPAEQAEVTEITEDIVASAQAEVPAMGTAATASGTCGENLTWTLEDGVLTISGTGEMTDYELGGPYGPWYSQNQEIVTVIIESGVTSIGDFAFSECSNIESISLPDGITKIGSYAFQKCSSLTDVEIPDSVEDLGHSGTFIDCTSLTSVVLPDSLTEIGGYAFSNCSSLESIDLPGSLTSLGYGGTFSGCSSLKSITIPDGVTGIGTNAFSYCKNLTGITLPDNAVSIDTYAFYYCGKLASVDIPDGVTSIGAYAFCYCEELASVSIPDSIRTLGKNAFSGCRALKSIAIPEGVTSIPKNAFSSCSSLESIELPDSITQIGEYAFEYCGSLKNMTIPQNVTSIGFSAFWGCESLTEAVVPDGITSLPNNVFYECRSLARVVLPEGITSLGHNMFYDCSSLTDVNIPDSVVNIGENVFHGCDSLTGIALPQRINTIPAGLFYNCSSLASITLPDGITGIGGHAFRGCRALQNIIIPDGVTSIGDSAFSDCTGLKSIVIPDGVTSMGESVFYVCTGLTDIDLPNGMDSIGPYMFYSCQNLQNITIPENVSSIGDNAFWRCTALTSINLPAKITDIGESAFYGCGQLSGTLVIPDGIQEISKSAFHGCSTLEVIQIPSGVTAIGRNAFRGCSSLTKLTIPEGVSSIGSGSFADCAKLENVNIPDIITEIPSEIFYGCDSLKSIQIPKNVTGIGDQAFRDCISLTDVVIPHGVTAIGEEAFRNCAAMQSIVIPDTVSEIGEFAFYVCYALTDVYYTGTETQWEDLMANIPSSSNNLLLKATIHCDYVAEDNEETISGTCGENLTWKFSGGTLTITVADPTAPSHEMYDYLPATAPWKDYVVTAVVVEEPVTTIGNNAFSGLADLKTVQLAGSLTSIGEYAFSACPSLTEIQIPNRVSSIGRNAFYLCTGLTRADLSTNITTIPASLFSGCTSLVNVAVPSAATFIGEGAFFNCSSLPSINIPSTVTTIEANTFDQCTSLDNVILPEGITAIGMMAFRGCTALHYLCLPMSLATVGNSAFSGCAALNYVEYRGSQSQWDTLVKNGIINDNGGNDPLVNVQDIRCLGEPAVPGNLAEGTCGPTATWSLSNDGDLTISGTGAMSDFGTDAGFNTQDIPWSDYDSSISSVVIEDGITSIGNYAFYCHYGLTKVSLPDSITKIGDTAFYACKKLSEITLPAKLTSIGTTAFRFCESLTSITIPEGVTKIQMNAFGDCTGLESITLPVSLASIEDFTFYNCPKLADVYYNGTQEQWDALKKNIGSDNECLLNAKIHVEKAEELPPVTDDFQGTCGQNLTWKFDETTQTLTISGTGAMTNFEVGAAPWKNYTDRIVSIELGVRVTTIGDQAFRGCQALRNVTLSSIGLTSIGVGAFADCISMTSLAIPYGLTQIGSGAFYGCNRLVSIGMPGSITTIGDYAFQNCTSLKEADLPSSLSRVSTGTFLNCSSLTSLDLPTSVETIGSHAFQNCSSLQTIHCSSYYTQAKNWYKLTLISENAFRNCTALSNITLPSSVKRIQKAAFDNCSGISQITYGGTKSMWEGGFTYGNFVLEGNSALQGENVKLICYDFSNEMKLIRKYTENWENKYSAYTSAVSQVLAEYIPANPETLQTAANTMMAHDATSDDKYITFHAGFPEEYKDECYLALAKALHNHVSSNVDFSEIDFDSKNEGMIVREICSKVWSVNTSYPFDMVTVSIVGGGYTGAGFGDITCNEKQTRIQYKGIYSNKLSEYEQIIHDYCEALADLGEMALDNGYAAFAEDILSAPLTKLSRTVLEQKLHVYNQDTLDFADEVFKEFGVGKVVGAIQSCYQYCTNLLDPINAAKTQVELKKTLYAVSVPSENFKNYYDDLKVKWKIKNALKDLQEASTLLETAVTDFRNGNLNVDNQELTKLIAKINCPVDVSIYNSTGSQIGYISEDETWHQDAILVEENCGAKTITVLTEEKVSFKLTATDYGTMSCSFEEYDSAGNPVGRLNYYDIPLTPQQVFSVKPQTDLQANQESIQITSDSASYKSDEYIPSSEDAFVTIRGIATAEDGTAGGSVSGDGTFIRGDAVVLMAVPSENYRFVGWYDGDMLVTLSSLYEFTAREDVNLTARFHKDAQVYISAIAEDGGATVGTGSYAIGDTASLLAVAGKGYRFAGWYIGEELVSTDAEYSFQAAESLTLRAAFLGKKGDLNKDAAVDGQDAVYLLWHTLFPEMYPLDKDTADLNADNVITDADALVLLWHILFPDVYPL